MLDLNAIQVFVEVVRAGSFAKAAKTLQMPSSTVSDRVAALEKLLGVSLLTRTTRSLKLTDAGDSLFKRSQPLLTNLSDAIGEAARDQVEPSGILRISYPPEFAAVEIAAAVAEYRRKFPRVSVELSTSNALASFNTDEVDLAIRGGHLKDSSLKAKKLGAGSMILIASSKYLRESTKIKFPQDLSNHQCVHFATATQKEFNVSWRLQRTSGGTATAKPSVRAVTNSFETLRELVCAHQGVGLIPEYFVRHLLTSKKLERVLPEWSTGETPVQLVWSSQRYPSKKVQGMVPILSAHISALLKSREFAG